VKYFLASSVSIHTVTSCEHLFKGIEKKFEFRQRLPIIGLKIATNICTQAVRNCEAIDYSVFSESAVDISEHLRALKTRAQNANRDAGTAGHKANSCAPPLLLFNQKSFRGRWCQGPLDFAVSKYYYDENKELMARRRNRSEPSCSSLRQTGAHTQLLWLILVAR
jgi:hypothetical protein